MKDLEQWILENKEAIYEAAPSEGHFAAFEEKLAALHTKTPARYRLRKLFKYAALLLLPLSLLFFLQKENPSRQATPMASSDYCSDEKNGELCEALGFYQTQISRKYAHLQSLTCPNGEAQKQEIENTLNDLRKEYADLRKEWKLHPQNEQIKAILNNNMRLQNEF